MSSKQLHFNKPQLKSMLIGAPNEVLIAGRGTGKTVGVLAPKTANCYFGTLPRGTGVLINASYTQAFTRLLPELVRGWERLGYINDHHFLIGRKPTDKWKKMWKWEGPYAPPMDYKYFVSWWNGAGAHVMSQERGGAPNGVSIDWIAGDEAKLLNAEKLKTGLYPANRGIIPAFANNPYHHGITLTTDMPVGSAGRWLLDRVSAMDKEKVNEIWKLQLIRFQLRYLLSNANDGGKKDINKQIKVIDDELNDLRRNLLYYHEASTLDNIHALGIDYIKQQLRDTTTFQFDTQILNLRPLKMEDGFYPDFDEEHHGYFAEHESYFDNLEYDPYSYVPDCRKDKDLNINAPLHIALDYNRRIHPLVAGQDNGKEIRVVKGLHALYPGKLKEAIQLFADYYRAHKRKFVYYWYDQTAVGDDNETRKCDDVMAGLRKAGWVVKGMYMGSAPTHEAKYRMYGHLLTEDGYYDKVLRMNRENCSDLIMSINQAEAEQRKDGFGKNKKPEQDPNTPAQEATHYSDAFDMLIYGMLESKQRYGVESKSGSSIVTSS